MKMIGPVSCWLPLRWQLILIVASVLFAIVLVGLGVAIGIDWLTTKWRP